MSFWDIFWPMFTAFMISNIILDGIHGLISAWLQRRQNQRVLASMAAQGIDPSQMMEGFPGMEGMPMMAGFNPKGETSSPGSAVTKEPGGYI